MENFERVSQEELRLKFDEFDADNVKVLLRSSHLLASYPPLCFRQNGQLDRDEFAVLMKRTKLHLSDQDVLEDPQA